jgi:gentisate 1,2-dioxygenase
MSVTASQESLEAYCAALREAGLDAPWSKPGPLIPSKASRVQPCVWRWSAIEPLLHQSAQLVAPGAGAERRILRLMNPGVPERTSTHTISLALQILLPGETAPSHRHTPNALRFMLYGRGAYTIVENERCDMLPGDLVITPSMTWHEHGNDGTEPVIWADGLDSPVVRYLEILAMQPRGRETPAKPAGAPASGPAAGASFPTQPTEAATKRTIHYRWDVSHRELFERAVFDPDPYDDVMIEYFDGATSGPVLPTIGCYLQLLRPGVTTRAHRQTSSAVYQVVRGSGATTMDGVRYEWQQGDFFAIPPMVVHAHANAGSEPVVLFSIQDVPLLKVLGHYYEADGESVGS